MAKQRVWVCQKCKESKCLTGFLRGSDGVKVKAVGCQKICKGPVAGLEVDGRMEWFPTSTGPNQWWRSLVRHGAASGWPGHWSAADWPNDPGGLPVRGRRALPAGGYVGDHTVREEWDRRYADREQLWSGRPNGALVAEVAGLTPRRVLDVGCGEGADAVWLARRGWDVTAIEVSGVALERAAGHALDAGVSVRWVHAGLVEAAIPAASFDLVSAQYPALLRTPEAAAERALLAAVAPGGVLLLVHHAMETHQAHEGGFDPADYVWPLTVAALLDNDWEVERDERRARVAPDGARAHHTDDLVLRARRLR